MFGHDDNNDKNDDTAMVTEPQTDDVVAQDAGAPADSPAAEPAFIATDQAGAPETPSPRDLPVPEGSADLLSIKQEALKQLSPLVGHLNQTPEEKFRTTMMMIQASDDQSLVKDAYSAAQAITDEKTKAQALLDIINEINYFTQQHDA